MDGISDLTSPSAVLDKEIQSDHEDTSAAQPQPTKKE